ncbi:ribonuclease P protein component [Corynebacterium aquatimens]|uniref:ribonuclease P protein component n=1 Tax=Corynebacterium TaxID=1716 RepID=UPI001F4618FC|nr:MULTISPECIES: ribonuclease P protein component [Corynebacterium]QYH19002.1 ribonuclease P protein component [Corynebacterium aquatimens]UIZ92151.1 ribonuclease P protein component [Corynebacterium sp. CNCTC7651]
MLPRPHKLSSSADFRRAMRKGARAGSRTLMVHVYRQNTTAEDTTHDPAAQDPPVIHGGPRFGLVVSKQVGNAVTRHAVSRKLREVLRANVDKLEPSHHVVVRALPAAATATSAELEADYLHALRKALAKSQK